jgi:osmotically-inducible protein OsmY
MPKIPAGDAEIRQAVINALHWDLAVPRHHVHVRVQNGWVTLSGRVEHAYSRTAAEADARAIPDVKGVTNAIEAKA